MNEYPKEGYRQRLDRQTKEWFEGKPAHNVVDDECCPDFSCCKPHLLAPKEVRQVFYVAYLKDDDKTKSRLLGEFLSRLIASEFPEKAIHIAGLDAMREGLE